MSRLANVPINPHTSPYWRIGILADWRSWLTTTLLAIGLLCSGMTEVYSQRQDTARLQQDTVKNLPYKPSRRPTFRLRDRYGDPFSNTTTESPLFLKDPTKVNMDVELDSNLNYTIYE